MPEMEHVRLFERQERGTTHFATASKKLISGAFDLSSYGGERQRQVSEGTGSAANSQAAATQRRPSQVDNAEPLASQQQQAAGACAIARQDSTQQAVAPTSQFHIHNLERRKGDGVQQDMAVTNSCGLCPKPMPLPQAHNPKREPRLRTPSSWLQILNIHMHACTHICPGKRPLFLRCPPSPPCLPPAQYHSVPFKTTHLVLAVLLGRSHAAVQISVLLRLHQRTRHIATRRGQQQELALHLACEYIQRAGRQAAASE